MTQSTLITLPSGRKVMLFEVIEGLSEQPESWFFRFIAPDLGPSVDYEAWEGDLEAMCAEVALPRVPDGVERVVIALADRELPFGAAAPEAVQIFEAFSVSDGHCRWEPF